MEYIMTLYYVTTANNASDVCMFKVSWDYYGWQPQGSVLERSADNTYVYVQCGGYCGHCRPTEPVSLLINPDAGRGCT